MLFLSFTFEENIVLALIARLFALYFILLANLKCDRYLNNASIHIKSDRFVALYGKYHGPFSFLSTANKVVAALATLGSRKAPSFTNVEYHLRSKAFLGFQYRSGTK